MAWLWWAPLVAALAHIFEEFVYPGGFADWDRAYRADIRSSITARLHLIVNAALVVACVSVGAAGSQAHAGSVRFHSAIPPRYAVAAWLALAALLFSNAIFHAAGTLRTGRVSPGVWTGLLLYVPVAACGFWHFLSSGMTSLPTAIVAALAGGSYHLWAALAHRARAQVKCANGGS